MIIISPTAEEYLCMVGGHYIMERLNACVGDEIPTICSELYIQY